MAPMAGGHVSLSGALLKPHAPSVRSRHAALATALHRHAALATAACTSTARHPSPVNCRLATPHLTGADRPPCSRRSRACAASIPCAQAKCIASPSLGVMQPLADDTCARRHATPPPACPRSMLSLQPHT